MRKCKSKFKQSNLISRKINKNVKNKNVKQTNVKQTNVKHTNVKHTNVKGITKSKQNTKIGADVFSLCRGTGQEED